MADTRSTLQLHNKRKRKIPKLRKTIKPSGKQLRQNEKSEKNKYKQVKYK